ncbi:MAG: hypothetical protein II856_04210 [Bacteroidales bacterium]|nr:hypothetical protein [Bacteroidales bacterium]
MPTGEKTAENVMNPQVEEFIQKQIEKQKKDRENHLIELGLYEYAKDKKIYSPWADKDSPTMGYMLKDEKGYYRYATEERKKALDITEEEYSLICKYCPSLDFEESQNKSFRNAVLDKLEIMRKMIKFFVIITIIEIVCGIIMAFIMAF